MIAHVIGAQQRPRELTPDVTKRPRACKLVPGDCLSMPRWLAGPSHYSMSGAAASNPDCKRGDAPAPAERGRHYPRQGKCQRGGAKLRD